MSKELYQLENAEWSRKITSGDPMQVKQAEDAVNDFTRVKLRENSFSDAILPPIQVSNSDLNRAVQTDKNYIVVDREPNSMGCISVPYGSLPMNMYIRVNRYPVYFDRVLTPRFSKDITELRTNKGIDIRQVISDNALKDLSTEKDGKFIQAVNSVLGVAGSTVPATGSVQHATFSGGITRETVAQAMTVMMKTPSNLHPARALINHVTAVEFLKWDRIEVGGDLSQEIAQRGWTSRTWFGVEFIITIKRDMIPDGTIYWFAAPSYLGKHYVLEQPTMHIERHAFMLQFFSYAEFGMGIGNIAGVARTNHTL